MSKLQERDVLIEPWFSVQINGAEFGEDMLKYVTAVEVTDEDEKFSEAVIEVSDVDMKWLNGIGIGSGSSLIVRMGHRKNNMSIFRGKISVIEVDYPYEGYPMLVVKGIDTGIQMMEARHSKIYKDMKVSEVVEAMHRTAGLEIEVDDSVNVMTHIQQTNETYAEFVHRWRKRLGWNYFKKPSGGYYFGKKKQIEFGKETLSYRTGGLEIISFTPTYVDVETEDKEDAKELENKEAEKKNSQYEKNYSKAGGGGGDAPVGKA